MERGFGPNVTGDRRLGRGDRIDVARRQARERRRQRVLVGRAVGVLVHRGAVSGAANEGKDELTVIDQLSNVPVLFETLSLIVS